MGLERLEQMLYETYAPPPMLAPYVRFFWALEASLEPGEEFVHRSMADGCVEMVFHYRSSFDEITNDGLLAASPIASIQAQSTSFRRFVTDRSFGIFGAYLYPFAIPRLFSLPAFDLTNISPDLGSVFGKKGSLLDEEVAAARDNTERVRAASRFLIKKLASSSRELSPVHTAVHTILHRKGNIDIPALAKEYGISKRQFERKFKEVAGLSPKLYSRVARFQAATHFKLSGRADLTEVAYACGYYDQSHFIHDFREFSGYTPKEYFWNEAEGTQYMNTEQMSHFSN